MAQDSHIIEFDYGEDGGQLLVEVDEAPTSGRQLVSAGNGISGKAEKSFMESMGVLQKVVGAVQAQMEQAVKKPDQIELEIGVKLSAEAGAIIAKASGEAHIKVKMTWKSE